jgi:hypothetical protein
MSEARRKYYSFVDLVRLHYVDIKILSVIIELYSVVPLVPHLHVVHHFITNNTLGTDLRS